MVARYTGKTIYIVFNFLCVKIAWKERKRGLEWPIWKRYKVFIKNSIWSVPNPYVDTNKLWVDIIPKGDMRPRSTYCNQIQVKAKIAPRHGTWQNFQSSIWPGTCYQGMDCQVFTLPFHRSLLWNFFGGFSTTWKVINRFEVYFWYFNVAYFCNFVQVQEIEQTFWIS